MAEVIKVVTKHVCHEEVEAAETMWSHPLYYGSVIRCSCGRQYKKVNNQRDGDYWESMPGSEYIEIEEPPAPYTMYNAA